MAEPSKSKRQKIVEAVVARMKTITTTNSYSMNLGTNVYDRKLNNWDLGELPGVSVDDEEEIVEARLTRCHTVTMSLSITAAVKAGTTTGAEMRKALADIITAIKVDETWSGEAIRTVYKGNKSGLMQEDYTVAMIQVKVDIEYNLLRFDPYTEAGQ